MAAARALDVAIIGGGVVGSAIAFELGRLSRGSLRVALFEAATDLGDAASGRNAGIVHTGFDAEPGSLESQLVTQASRTWPELARTLGIPLLVCGAAVVARSHDEFANGLRKAHAKALANGVSDVVLRSPSRAEPFGALWVPREAVTDPFRTVRAFAEGATRLGRVAIHRRAAVRAIEPARSGEASHRVCFETGETVSARVVINAAGLGAAKLALSYGGEPFTLVARHGEFLVFDGALARLACDRAGMPLPGHILLPLPTPTTKGILVAPTIFGDVIAGPTARDLTDRPLQPHERPQPTSEGQANVRLGASVFSRAFISLPAMGSWAGHRPHCVEGTYRVRWHDGARNIVTIGGVRSTGLTAAWALAQHVVGGLQLPQAAWRPLSPVDGVDQFAPSAAAPAASDDALICTCRGVTRAQLAGAPDIAAARRRTRVCTGRCQGFHCRSAVDAALAGAPPRAQPMPGPWDAWDTCDVAIVGGGPAGLGAATALRAAGRGLRVLLLERAETLGGIAAAYSAAPAAAVPPTFALLGGGGWPQLVHGAAAAAHWRAALARASGGGGGEFGAACGTFVAGIKSYVDGAVLRVQRGAAAERLVHARRVIVATGAREASLSERDGRPDVPAGAAWDVVCSRQLHEVPAAAALVGGRRVILHGAADLISDALRLQLAREGVAWHEASPGYVNSWLAPSRLHRAIRDAAHFTGVLRPPSSPLQAQAARADDAAAASFLVVVAGALVPLSDLLLAYCDPRTREVQRAALPPTIVLAGNVATRDYPAWLCWRAGAAVGARVAKDLQQG